MRWLRAFLDGMGSVLNLWPELPPPPRRLPANVRVRPLLGGTEEDARALAEDCLAIRSDWQVVGDDLRRATESLDHQRDERC